MWEMHPSHHQDTGSFGRALYPKENTREKSERENGAGKARSGLWGTRGSCSLEHLPRGQALQGDQDLQGNQPDPETQKVARAGTRATSLERTLPAHTCCPPTLQPSNSSDTGSAHNPQGPFSDTISLLQQAWHQGRQINPPASGRPPKGRHLAHSFWSSRLRLESGPFVF